MKSYCTCGWVGASRRGTDTEIIGLHSGVSSLLILWFQASNSGHLRFVQKVLPRSVITILCSIVIS